MNETEITVDRERLLFTMTRVFDAPRELVWKVYVDPAHIPDWWGPGYLTTTVEKMDVHPGGSWRYIQQDADGNVYPFAGVYKTVQPPEILAYTFEYEGMPGNVTTETLTFESLPDGRTKITASSSYASLTNLNAMLETGMEGGAIETWDRLAGILKSMTP